MVERSISWAYIYPFLAVRHIFPQMQVCKLVKLAPKHFINCATRTLKGKKEIPWESGSKFLKSNTCHIALHSVDA